MSETQRASFDEDFTSEDVIHLLQDQHNWGRWGADDQVGAINLITEQKRREAASLVRLGKTVSLARKFPKEPGPGNPRPAQHYMHKAPRAGGGGSSKDFYGIFYHGILSTHIDALCHVWDKDQMWNGRNPDEEITFDGSRWGHIDVWGDGIVTRGVLLDVPRYRGVPFVTQDEPVQGSELRRLCESSGIEVRPGDALIIHSGREAWEREHGRPWGAGEQSAVGEFRSQQRPGLHSSCLQFIRETDCAMLVWDMMDHFPVPFGLPFSVHGSIFAFGIALVDNALIEPLADICSAVGIHDFQFVVAPLRVQGGTGSPVNPLAIL
jgi:hypothetical protein